MLRTTLAGVLLGFTAATAAFAETKYTYDALGRVTNVQVVGGAAHGQYESFSYDAAGNRVQVQKQAPSVPATTVVPSTTNLILTGGQATLTLAVGNSSTGGTVSVSMDGAFITTATVVNGTVTIQIPDATVGEHKIRVTYSGDANHLPTTFIFDATVRDLSWLPAVLDLILN